MLADTSQQRPGEVAGAQGVKAADEGHNNDAFQCRDHGGGEFLDGALLGLDDFLLQAFTFGDFALQLGGSLFSLFSYFTF